jgi:hypothetical protein
MPKITIYYIDDEASSKNAERYRRRLSNDNIDCVLFAPPAWDKIDLDLTKKKPSLFLIDYDLALAQPDGFIVGYRGSTLAAELRSRLPEVPIVLITRQSVLDSLNPQVKRQITDRFKAYDGLIFKQQIDEELEDTRNWLISLANGFTSLSKVRTKNWSALVRILGARASEEDQIREAIPPISQDSWAIVGLSGWITNVFLYYPGLAYDSLHAATLLGISEESFVGEKIQDFLGSAKYTGAFSPPSGRWWKNRLLEIAKSLSISESVDGPVNTAFRIAFEKKNSVKLKPSKCVWDHKPTADWVCYILNKPVKLRHSIRYYPDDRPSVMDSARVSFKAVRERKDFDENLTDSEGQRLLKMIEELEEP